MILDPFDPEVIANAKKSGISDGVIESAQRSPVYQFVMKWKIALPPHIEYRTLPMLFYVPPMSPVQASKPEDTITSRERGSVPRHRRVPRPDEVPRQPVSVRGTKALSAMHFGSRRPSAGIAARRPWAMSIEPWPTACCAKPTARAKKRKKSTS